jgi:hypothetical protein
MNYGSHVLVLTKIDHVTPSIQYYFLRFKYVRGPCRGPVEGLDLNAWPYAGLDLSNEKDCKLTTLNIYDYSTRFLCARPCF